MSNIIFQGGIDVVVPEQIGLTPGQRRLLRDSFSDGTGLPQKVRYACAIAVAVNETIKDGITVNGKRYEPNPKVRAQFGKNQKQLPYLTFGLIDPATQKKYTLTWEGANNIPLAMVKTAVKHDQGRRQKTISIPLALDSAVVHETGNKAGRAKKKVDPRRNHDTGKDGKAYPRRPRKNHNRLCPEDVNVLLRQMSAATRAG